MTETLKTIATNRLIDGDKLAAIKTDGTGTTLFLSDDGTYKAPPGSTGPGTGDVVGPASAVDSNFAAFNTTTGKLIKDSGSKASDFATAAQGAKADTAVQPAGLSGYELLANKDTDGTLAANSDTKYPSQKAVKTYADTKQPVCEEKTTSFTAAIHGNYVITGTATVTDPTPEAGHGFTCLVRNGTATIGGTAYAIVGTRIERTYHSGAWANAVWLPSSSMLELAGGTMTGDITLGENASIAQDPALSADGKYTGTTVTGTAGATLAFGDLVYLDPTDSRWELADANSAAAADGDARGIIGICVLAAANDGDATKVLLHGMVRADTAFPSFTINAPIYVSETAGDVTGTQPTTADVVIRVVGFGYTADSMWFAPSSDFITHT